MYKTYKGRSAFVGRGKLSRFRRISDDFNGLSITLRTVRTVSFERLRKCLTGLVCFTDEIMFLAPSRRAGDGGGHSVSVQQHVYVQNRRSVTDAHRVR